MRVGDPGPDARRHAWSALALTAAIVLVSGCSLTTGAQPEEFCEAWGVLTEGPKVTYGEVTLLVGEPISNRVPCDGNDLWHYLEEDLANVDGVLFDNCEISWVGGGRSTAAAEGIDC